MTAATATPSAIIKSLRDSFFIVKIVAKATNLVPNLKSTKLG